MATARRQQRTIAREAEVRGVGFFQGHDVSVRFRPAAADTGVVFVRTDLPGRPSVPALVDHVVPSPRRTTLRRGEATVEMVEHVMAALAGLRVDNCEVEIDAPEAPGCDGSSRAFSEALAAAGSVELDRPRAAVVVDQPVTVRDGSAVLTAHPGGGDGLVLAYQLDYGRGNPIGSQSLFLDVNPETFAAELAPSRTFLLEAEARALRQAGIGARASAADLLIFGPDGVVGNALRYPDECVRHKILDMVGDLALLGKDIVGHVVAHRSGHQLNAALVRELAARDRQTGPAEDEPEVEPRSLDVEALMRVLPHRYPFLLVDRVIAMVPGRRVTAIKNVSANEPFFQGHWPGRPVMPGVLILEALAQAAGVMISDSVDQSRQVTVIAAIDDVRIRRPVRPGDQLRLEVTCRRLKRTCVQAEGVALVDGQVAAEATFTFVMMDAERTAA